MQPDRNQNEWQQPEQQPTQSPYTPVNPGVQAPQQPIAPVVSLTPENSAPVAPQQPPVEQQTPAPVATQPTTTATPIQEVSPEENVAEEPAPAEQEPVHWQANEYIHHEKSPIWFILFAIVVVGLIAGAVFVIQSVTFAILVPVMAAALLVYTHRPPRVLDYTLSRQGIHVNDHLYPFTEFKSFGVIHDGEEYSVMLLPTKRFKPGTSVYFPEEAGEAIVDMLGARLPMEDLHLDVVDKVVRKLRI
jgi:hypothetical protein